MKRVANEVVAAITSALYPSRNIFDQYEAPNYLWTFMIDEITEAKVNATELKRAQRQRAIERKRDPGTWAHKEQLKKAKRETEAAEKQREDQQRKAEAAERRACGACALRRN